MSSNDLRKLFSFDAMRPSVDSAALKERLDEAKPELAANIMTDESAIRRRMIEFRRRK
jgi:hypothetical protein